MPSSFTPVQIDLFKREAKLLCRASAISHSQALDRIASEHGYSNWSLLMKHSDLRGAAPSKDLRPPFRFTRTPDLMRSALLKVPEPPGTGRRSDAARAQVEDVSHDFVSPQNAVTFAIDYMTCLLTVPRFSIHSAAPVYWEMRSWLPYGCNEVGDGLYILVNRGYKPVGQVGAEWANYEDFPYLHARLTNEQFKQFSGPEASDGYLFNDGCPPWDSREDAAAYLGRLHRFRDAMRR